MHLFTQTGAAVLALLVGSACSGAPGGGAAPGARVDVPSQQLTFDALRFRVYRGPLLVAEGQARSATFRRDNGDLTADHVTARFPAEPGRVEARLEAAQGDGNVRERRFRAYGGVKSVQSGQVATTAEATWSQSDGMVRGDKPVEIRRGRLVVRGPGFTIDPHDGRLRIAGGAQAEAVPVR